MLGVKTAVMWCGTLDGSIQCHMTAILTRGKTGHEHVQKQVQGQGLIVH